MKINLTKKQYETLAKTVYLGHWMANAQRATGRLEEYRDILEYVFSLAPEFGYSENLEYQLERGTEEKESEVYRLHAEYDNSIFFTDLPNKLGNRDFLKQYTEEERKEMSKMEHFEKIMECVDKWEDELSAHGIERLGIVEKK